MGFESAGYLVIGSTWKTPSRARSRRVRPVLVTLAII